MATGYHIIGRSVDGLPVYHDAIVVETQEEAEAYALAIFDKFAMDERMVHVSLFEFKCAWERFDCQIIKIVT